VGLGAFVAIRASSLSGKIFVGQKNSFLNQVGQFLSGNKLEGESNGQINVLLLGIGGEGHDGPYLSDSIIVAQIRPADKRITMISIPRDYLADLGGKYGERKINSAFAEGFARNGNFDEAGKMARETVERVSGLTIPYFAVIDFQGFEKAIDLVDGIDVTVDRTFTDYTYPNNTEGYLPPVTFTAGPEHMNGKRALIFARSRHAAGPEGTDFARSQRQQKMLQAFKTKVVDLNLVTDSGKVNSLFGVVGEHFHTNIGLSGMLRLYEIGKDFTKDNIVSLSLDPATGLVCDGKQEETGAYIIVPCEGKTKTDIKNFFKNSFSATALTNEKSIVWLADSSKTGKLYAKAAKTLTTAGATVVQLTYTGTPLSQNVVYQINNKPDTLKFIKDNLSASEVTLPPPGVKVNKDKADLIVILGSDSN
jgi:LCP family protein required for cell wall assembly